MNGVSIIITSTSILCIIVHSMPRAQGTIIRKPSVLLLQGVHCNTEKKTCYSIKKTLFIVKNPVNLLHSLLFTRLI